MFARGRCWWSSISFFVVLVVLSGCSSQVTGTGAQSATRAGDPRTANQLASDLMDVPTGSVENQTAFDEDRTPTFDEFSRGYYGTTGSDHLRELGVSAVVHEGWTAADGNGAEVVLFLFHDHDAASGWVSTETTALRDAGAMPASLDGLPDVVGCMFTQYAGGGSQDRRYYAAQGRVGMTFNFSTPPASGLGQAPAWVGEQLRRLA